MYNTQTLPQASYYSAMSKMSKTRMMYIIRCTLMWPGHNVKAERSSKQVCVTCLGLLHTSCYLKDTVDYNSGQTKEAVYAVC